jgi:hypothetical protein
MIAGQTSTPERGRAWVQARAGVQPPTGPTRASAAPVLSQIKVAYPAGLNVSTARRKFGQGEGGATAGRTKHLHVGVAIVLLDKPVHQLTSDGADVSRTKRAQP